MKTIYAIRDRIAQELVGFNMYVLFVFRTDQQAVRYFADAINDQKSILNKHPTDYELVACGTIDDDGIIAHFVSTKILITGDALITAQELTLEKAN